MRFLHSIHSVDPAVGGPVEYIRQLIPLHKQSGHDITVASMDDPQKSFVKDFPTEIHAFGPSLPGYGYSSKYVPWLRRERSRFDAVIIHGLWQYPAIGTWLALHNTDTPYFIFPHGMLDPWFKQAFPLKHLRKSLYWRLSDYRVMKDASAALFASEEECRLSSQTFSPFDCRQIVVGMGIAEPVGDSNNQREIFLNNYPHLRGKRLILFLGRMHEKKGCDLLLASFAKLLPRNEPLHLVTAGPDDNKYAAQLKEQCRGSDALRETVTWTGLLAGDLKWGAFHAADVSALPSHQENFAIAVVEALACGKSVLISNKVNIWQEIADSGQDRSEADDLAGTDRLLAHWFDLPPEKQREMQINAKRCFEQKFRIRTAYGNANISS